MISSKATYPQLSIWSTDHTTISQQQKMFDNSVHCFDNVTNEDSTELKKQRNCSPKKFFRCCSKIPPCLRGLLLGVLIGCLALSVIIPLWLTSTNKTTGTLIKTSLESSITGTLATTIDSVVSTLSTTANSSSTTIISGGEE